jgi:hypothetical protein
VSKDANTQLTLATRWGVPNRDQIGAGERIAGPAYMRDLVAYCPSHPTAMLTDLTLEVVGF